MTLCINKEKTEWEPTERVSIDAINLHKEHPDFVTVVSDVEQGILIEVIDSHQQAPVIETLMERSLQVHQAVREVSGAAQPQ